MLAPKDLVDCELFDSQLTEHLALYASSVLTHVGWEDVA